MTGPISSNLMLSPSLILGIDGSFDDSGSCSTSFSSLLSSLLFIVDDVDLGLVDMAETVMRFLLTNALLSLEKIMIARRNTANDVAVAVIMVLCSDGFDFVECGVWSVLRCVTLCYKLQVTTVTVARYIILALLFSLAWSKLLAALCLLRNLLLDCTAFGVDDDDAAAAEIGSSV